MMPAAPKPEQFWFLDTLVTVHVSHTQGGDTISLLEHQAPIGHSPPLHIHRSEDELFHVLSGDFRFHIGGREEHLTTGAFLLTPKGLPHTFRIQSSAGGRWLTITSIPISNASSGLPVDPLHAAKCLLPRDHRHRKGPLI
jgi:uncharacterized cupin superfamily protein